MHPIEPSHLPQLRRISRIMTNVARSAREVELKGVFALPEFCGWCGAPVEGYELCFNCKEVRDHTERSLLPDNIGLLTYAIHGTQSAADAYSYKDGGASNESLSRLKILVNFFILYHSGCFRLATGMRVDALAHVPSGKGRTPHPLETQIMKLFPEDQLTPIRLHPRGTARTEGREEAVDPERHEVLDDVNGRHVLLLEDTWVRGYSALSGVAALKQAGAASVSLLALTRYLRSSFPATQQWLAGQEELAAYDPRFCPVTRSFSCPGADSP